MKRGEKRKKKSETIITLDEEGQDWLSAVFRKLFERPVTGEVIMNASQGKVTRVHLTETDAQSK